MFWVSPCIRSRDLARGMESGQPRTNHYRDDVGREHEGYRVVSVYWDGSPRSFGVHNVAWMLFYGDWPETMLDHVNRDGLDNRIVNLRPASTEMNGRNRHLARNNRSGFRGVSWNAAMKKWKAKVSVGEMKTQHLGYFDTPQEASAAVEAARKLLDGAFYWKPDGDLKDQTFNDLPHYEMRDM